LASSTISEGCLRLSGGGYQKTSGAHGICGAPADRNKLLVTGTLEDTRPGQSLTVNTEFNTNVAAMTDVELEDYRQSLRELNSLLPEEVPKVIEAIVTDERAFGTVQPNSSPSTNHIDGSPVGTSFFVGKN
jgi:hypothetical protein